MGNDLLDLTVRMMRENKDIVRMTKKQGRFFDGLDLEKQSSLEGNLRLSYLQLCSL